MAGIEQFSMEVSDESRSKRRSLAGLEESETANYAVRLMCFAPLVLSSGNAPGQSGEPRLVVVFNTVRA